MTDLQKMAEKHVQKLCDFHYYMNRAQLADMLKKQFRDDEYIHAYAIGYIRSHNVNKRENIVPAEYAEHLKVAIADKLARLAGAK